MLLAESHEAVLDGVLRERYLVLSGERAEIGIAKRHSCNSGEERGQIRSAIQNNRLSNRRQSLSCRASRASCLA